jgi:hypothetical protein
VIQDIAHSFKHSLSFQYKGAPRPSQISTFVLQILDIGKYLIKCNSTWLIPTFDDRQEGISDKDREQGKLPFEWVARYGIDYRDRLPRSCLGGLQRTGMSDQFETFNFQAFVQRANWPAFSALLISMFALIFLFLLLGATTQSIAG